MIKPTPQAEEVDLAEQARPVEDDIEERETLPEPRGDARDADVSDSMDQKLSGPVHGKGGPTALTDRDFRPIWQSNSVATYGSFIDDMASMTEPCRPNW